LAILLVFRESGKILLFITGMALALACFTRAIDAIATPN
jgi:hypothetical protein